MLTLRGVKMLARMNSVPRDKTGTDWTASTVAAKRVARMDGAAPQLPDLPPAACLDRRAPMPEEDASPKNPPDSDHGIYRDPGPLAEALSFRGNRGCCNVGSQAVPDIRRTQRETVDAIDEDPPSASPC